MKAPTPSDIATPESEELVAVASLLKRGRDKEAKKRRRNKMAEMLAESRGAESRQLDIIKNKLERAKRKDELVTLWSTEASVLLRALEATDAKSKVGAPATMAQYHMWVAIHFLHLRKKEKDIVAYRLVGETWGVTKTTIVKAVKGLKTADESRKCMASLFVNLDPDDPDEQSAFDLNLYTWVNTYLHLGS
jgi:hypothetical protein